MSTEWQLLFIRSVLAIALFNWSLPALALDDSAAKGADATSASATTSDAESLDQIRLDSEASEGAFYQKDDQVEVKAPMLKALIMTSVPLSPYQLDADSARSVSLRSVAETALSNNLAIKISDTNKEVARWHFWNSMGQFLPEMDNSVAYQGLTGKYASPFGLIAQANGPYLVIPNSLSLYLFKGGQLLYGALKTRHEYKASIWALKGTTNDILLDATKLYYQLALNNALLQIRIKGVEIGETLLKRNQIMFDNGANTKLDVLQARTQLSKDRQNLISQQIERRNSAIKLSTALNLDPSVDLLLQDDLVRKTRLIDSSLKINDLINIAVSNRPELKKFEQLRQAAKDNIKVVRGRLLPTVQGTGVLATTGALAGSAGQAQSSSASTGGVSAGAFSTSSSVPSGSSSSTKFSMTELYQIGITAQWTLPGMGTVDMANLQAARWDARRVQLEGIDQLYKVYEEVRESYLDGIKAESLIDETTTYVDSAREQLNVATTRLAEGVDTDLSAVIAERDYTNALIDKANAIINFNIAQAKLLRSIGRISLDTLTRGVPLKN